MKRLLSATVMLGALLGATGCAYNTLWGSNSVSTGKFFGDLGLPGNGNTVMVQDGSRLVKLSFLGDANTVTVANDAVVLKIEFFGKDNTVSVPENLVIRVTGIGRGNQVIRRPIMASETLYTPLEPYRAPAGEAPPPTAAPTTRPAVERRPAATAPERGGAGGD